MIIYDDINDNMVIISHSLTNSHSMKYWLRTGFWIKNNPQYVKGSFPVATAANPQPACIEVNSWTNKNYSNRYWDFPTVLLYLIYSKKQHVPALHNCPEKAIHTISNNIGEDKLRSSCANGTAHGSSWDVSMSHRKNRSWLVRNQRGRTEKWPEKSSPQETVKGDVEARFWAMVEGKCVLILNTKSFMQYSLAHSTASLARLRAGNSIPHQSRSQTGLLLVQKDWCLEEHSHNWSVGKIDPKNRQAKQLQALPIVVGLQSSVHMLESREDMYRVQRGESSSSNHQNPQSSSYQILVYNGLYLLSLNQRMFSTCSSWVHHVTNRHPRPAFSDRILQCAFADSVIPCAVRFPVTVKLPIIHS